MRPAPVRAPCSTSSTEPVEGTNSALRLRQIRHAVAGLGIHRAVEATAVGDDLFLLAADLFALAFDSRYLEVARFAEALGLLGILDLQTGIDAQRLQRLAAARVL